MKKIKYIWGIILIVALCSLPVMSTGGLNLVSSTPENGAVDVAKDTELTITFDKNISNSAVADQNRQCFTFLDPNGQEIACDVILPNDLVEPEKANTATIISNLALWDGTSYTIKIDGSLTALTGETLGEDLTISFTTQGKAPIGGIPPFIFDFVIGVVAVSVFFTIFRIRRRRSGKD